MTKIFIYYLFFIPITTWGGDAIVNAGVNEYIVLGVTMILNFVTEFLFSRIFILVIDSSEIMILDGIYIVFIVCKGTGK